MRRPFVLFAFCEAAGILLAYYTNLKLLHLCLIGAGVFLYAFFAKSPYGSIRLRNKGRLIAGIMVFSLILGFFVMSKAMTTGSAVLKREGDAGRLTGVVKTVAVKDGYYALIMQAESVGPARGEAERADEDVLVRLKCGEDKMDFVYSLSGRRISVTGDIIRPEGRRNFGCFDYSLYLKTLKIYAIVEVSEYKIESGPVVNALSNVLSVKKGQFFRLAMNYMDRDSFSLMAGLLFGEKGFMDEDVYTRFQSQGVSHILAVSGLHVSLLYNIILGLLKNRRNKKTSLIVCLSLICYAFLSNFSISVLRASFMIAVRLLAFHVHRRYDPLTGASVCAVVFMSLSPFYIFNAGFQLSFLAAFSMGLVLPWFELKTIEIADRLHSERLIRAGEILNPCIAVQLGMIPLTMYHFNMFSPLALLLNPLAIGLAALILPAGLLLFIFSLFGSGLSFIAIAGAGKILCRALLFLSEGANIPGSFGSCVSPPIGLIILYYGLFFFFFSEGRHILYRQRKYISVSLISLAVIMSSCFVPLCFGLSDQLLPWRYESKPLTFLDVGQGDSIHISSGGFNVLVDGGGNFYGNIAGRSLKPYLLKNGVKKLDLAIVTHMDSDHYLGISQLSEIYRIDKLILPSVYRGDEEIKAKFNVNEIIYVSAGDVINMGDMKFTVLAPGRDNAESSDDNESSLVMDLEIEGLRVLLTGDMTEGCERRLLASPYINADILKISHHGSAYSSCEDFVSAVSPAFAFVSCGKNNSHGHPAPRVVELMSEFDIILGRSDESGAIRLRQFSEDSMYFINAGRTKTWLIQRQRQTQNTPTRP